MSSHAHEQRQISVRASHTSESYDETESTVEIVYSTGARVDRGDYLEDLVVSPDAIDTSRLDAGAVPLIVDHAPWGPPVGRVVGHRIEGGRAIAIVKLSVSDASRNIVADIRAGVIKTVSVGYDIIERAEREENGRTVIEVTRWQPWEISLVAIPADANAQIRAAAGGGKHRRTEQHRGKLIMSNNTARRDAVADTAVDEQVDGVTAETAATDAVAVTAEEAVAAVESLVAVAEAAAQVAEAAESDTQDDAAATAATAERARAADITAFAARHGVPHELTARLIRSGATMHEVRTMTANTRAAGAAPRASGARVVRDEREGLAARAEAAIYGRLTGRRDAAAGDLAGARITDIARDVTGFRSRDDHAVIRHAVRSAGMLTTSDLGFASAVSGAIQRRVRELSASIEVALMPLVQRSYVRDFRPVESYSISGFPELLETPEGAEYTVGTLTSESGSFSVKKFGRILSLSFEAMVNDDLRMLDKAIRGAAAAGVKLEQKLIRAAFGAKLADGKALFHVSRGNLIAQDLDLAGLSAARTALRKQKGMDGDELGLAPRFLIVSPDLETAALQLVSPITAAVTGQVNPFAGTLTVIVDSSLDGDEWILAADPAMGNAIELIGLEGREGVEVEEVFDPRNDGMSWRARTFAAAAPSGWQGFVKSTGSV